MLFKTPRVSYSDLKLQNIFSERFRHLLLLLYWLLYMFVFMFLEKEYAKYVTTLGKDFHIMYSPIDSMIPFNEWFLIPYLFWFLYIVLSLAYTLFYDVDTFKRLMYFIMITYSAALICYFFYPTVQFLRPTSFERQNILTEFMRWFYSYDTNTNVCPSVHVIGSIASTLGFVYAKGVSKTVKVGCHIMNVLICLSTVFLKQHSVIDIVAALPICLFAYFICFKFEGIKKHRKKQLAI